MAYNSNIPQASDDPSQSQSEILGNFQELNTFLSVNHEDLNSADQGKHKFMQMPEQGSAPTTAANEGALYTKAVSAVTELFFRAESSGDELQLTSAFKAAGAGYIEIPGGLLVKWGNGAGVSGTTVSFDTTVPFTTCYAVVCNRASLTAGSQALAVGPSFPTATNFKYYFNGSGSISIFYIAIGVK